MQTIPLFPLSMVLFPEMPLLLHIFEPRYLEMIAWCREHDSPFGVVLIRRGEEALGPLAEPYRVGCLARIISVDNLPGERLRILAVGEQRFRIHALDDHLPYLTGEVEEFPLLIDDSRVLNQRAGKFLRQMRSYMKHLYHEGPLDLLAAIKPPSEVDEEILFFATALLRIPPVEQQALLEMERAVDLVDELSRIYARELVLLKNVKVDDDSKGKLPPRLNQN